MKIHEIHLRTASLPILRDFYQGLLGLDGWSGPAGQIILRIGHSQLHFHEYAGHSGIYHFAINVPLGQLEQALAYLHQRSVPALQDASGGEVVLFPNWKARAVYFLDPTGNILEFIARQDRKAEKQGPFDLDDWLEISEIGVVTSDVLAWRAQARERFGVGDFEKQSASPQFAALGTDDGLFIVVPVGRKWLMADTPATAEFVEVKFENAAGQVFFERF